MENLVFFHLLNKRHDLMEQFHPEFFSDPDVRQIFDISLDFVKRYKTTPSMEQVIELANIQGKLESIRREKIEMFWRNDASTASYSDEWLDNQAKALGKWMTYRTAVVASTSYLRMVEETITPDNVDEVISKSQNMMTHGLSFKDAEEGSPVDFFDMTNHQTEKLDTRSTGYEFIDLCLNGGFSNRSLIVLMGGPKTGKSLWLSNLAAKSILQGNNTIYITLEMSYQLVNQRIGSNIFNIPMSEYEATLANPADFRDKVKKVIGGRLLPVGKMFVKEFPTSSATAKDIESIILQKEQELTDATGKPFKFKNVFIDYINIMKDLKNPNSENTYQKIKSICEDVRAMAQRNDWCVVSVTQTNRNGMESTDLSMTDVSESAGLIATVDALFGIIRNTIMRADNVYYLKALALRNSQHMGDRKKYKFVPSVLRIDEDDTEAIIQDGQEIPQVYQSAAVNAANKKFGKQPQGGGPLGAPVYSEPIPAPKLGITEQQITGQDLFKI